MLEVMSEIIGASHLQINSIKLHESTQPLQDYDEIYTEKLSASYNNAEDMKIKGNEEGSISHILLNKIPIGEACLPYEVIKVQTENGLVPITFIYDTGWKHQYATMKQNH